MHAISEAFRLVQEHVVEIGATEHVARSDDMDTAAYAYALAQAGAISPSSARAVEGMSNLHRSLYKGGLAYQGELGGAPLMAAAEQAREYVRLARVVLFGLSRPPRRTGDEPWPPSAG